MATYRYTAFGEPDFYNESGEQLAGSAIDNDILWNVKRYSEASGLYMYLYRHYEAEHGRWPSRDPIAEQGGVNLYGVVGNRVMNNRDHLGLVWAWDAFTESNFSISYDPAMTPSARSLHGPPTSYAPPSATVVALTLAHSLGGHNGTIFNHYLRGGGRDLDVTAFASVDAEVETAVRSMMLAEMARLRTDVESFQCPQKRLFGSDYNPTLIGDTAFSGIARTNFTSATWVIRRAWAGLDHKVNAIVVCKCNNKTTLFEPLGANISR